MEKAEKLLEKHVNHHYLNFLFHDQKQTYNEIIDALNEALGLTHVNGWLMVSGNETLFNQQAKKNCMVLFDDGTECRYSDKHPNAILTHFKTE